MRTCRRLVLDQQLHRLRYADSRAHKDKALMWVLGSELAPASSVQLMVILLSVFAGKQCWNHMTSRVEWKLTPI